MYMYVCRGREEEGRGSVCECGGVCDCVGECECDFVGEEWSVLV